MDGRNSNGQFVKGGAGGPGRPKRAVEADYLAAITTAVSPDDWQQIVARAVKDAKKGDARARDWLSRHLVGDRSSVDLIHHQQESELVAVYLPDNGRGSVTTIG